ncbi:RNA editing complex protein MP90, partial [Trypanosoma grayi]|uniref:RNA editing complex protein MP90 n=1 Tax=Trypanosoma grayi TaxID=71804 RepID=UPI0004F4A80F
MEAAGGGNSSGGGGGGADGGSAPLLSRHSRSFMQKKLQKGAKKEDGDKRLFQKSLTGGSKFQRSLQCLTTFDCPVCRLKNSVRVDLHAKERQAVVRCTYCMSVCPRPRDLPYPYSASYVPKLENRADVFFKFNELYRSLAMAVPTEGEEHDVSGSNAVEACNYSGDGVLAISSNLLSSAAAAAVHEKTETDADGGHDDEEEEEEEEMEDEEVGEGERKS